MLVVGLTGGIGSGKSTVEALFAGLGVPVLDADRVAREVVEPGTPGFEAVVDLFGREIVDDEGRLDRAAIRDRVFRDPEQRARLEAIVHPLVRSRIREHLSGLDAPYAVVAIPLLLEADQTDLVDRILVVDVPEEIQIRRATQRDGSQEQQVRAVLGAQCSRAERLEAADEVIDNSGDREALGAQVRRLHSRYMDLAVSSPH